MSLRYSAYISSYSNSSTGTIFRHLYKHLRLGYTNTY